MIDGKKSFILYLDSYENIKSLSINEKGLLLDAIFNHALDNEFFIDGIAGMAFKFIKQQMDRDSKKYNDFINKQKENGLKGGRPKNNPTVKSKKPNNPTVNLKTQKSLYFTH